MHMAEAAALGMRLEYERIDLAQGSHSFHDVIADREERGYAGLNITHPYKQLVLELMDELSPDAERIGAVNTVVFRDGRRIGHNTDWSGFATSFQRDMQNVPLKRIMLVGAGGAGSAVAYALLTMAVDTILLFDTDAQRADILAARLSAREIHVVSSLDPIDDSDGLINATPVGMDTNPGMVVPPLLLRPDLWVADVVYFPLVTELLRTARALGCRTLDGGGMAVYQAARSFELFTGVQPDSERMLRWFRSHTGSAPQTKSVSTG